MSRECQRRVRGSLFKKDSFAGQRIKMGSSHIGIAITGKVVGAQRIQRDQDDIRFLDGALGPELLDSGRRALFETQNQP